MYIGIEYNPVSLQPDYKDIIFKKTKLTIIDMTDQFGKVVENNEADTSLKDFYEKVI